MQLSQITYTLLLAGAVYAQASSLSINTPTGSLIVGVPIQISWTGGSPPYTLLVNSYSNGQVGGLLDTIGSIQSSPYTFTPTTAEVGKQLQFDIRDSTGAQGQSGGTPATVEAATGGSSSGSSSSSSPSSSSAASGSSSTAASGSSSSAGSSTSPASSSQTSSGSSSSTKSNGAASIRGVAGAVAGVVGMAAAALF